MKWLLLGYTLVFMFCRVQGQTEPVVFKVFCFPSDKIPRIDGDTHDWDIVPASYTI